MMKRIYFAALIAFLAIALTACSATQAPPTVTPPSQGEKPVIGDITPKAVYLNSSEMEKLSDSKIKDWYLASYKKAGLHSLTSGQDQYLLISAGEQRTSGYFIDDIRVTGEEKGLRVTAKLYGPDKEAVVAQVITYPHIVVVVPSDKRDLVFNLDQMKQVVTYTTNSARFINKSSADTVELKISGQPDSMPATSFKLAQDIKGRFDSLHLAKEDVVRFVYVTTLNNQKLIIDMVKIGPVGDPVSEGKGKYVGQIDANSVEIVVDGKSQAFRLSEELKTKIGSLGLKKDDPVSYEFRTNEHKQFVLSKLEKTNQ